MTAQAIVAALLLAFAHWPARRESARVAAEHRVSAILTACEIEHATRAECLATVAECYVESGLRARHESASLCGCQPYATDDATQARCAVRAVVRSLRVCAGDAVAASTRYIDGHCAVPRGASARWAHLVGLHVAQTARVRRALAGVGEVECAR